jgi:hypothetical protein
MTHEHQVSRNHLRGLGRRKQDPREELRRTEVREAIMASVVVAAVALFLLVAAIGVVVAVATAVRREDRHYSLIGEAPGKLAGRARRLNGVGRRDLDPKLFRPVVRPVGDLVP